MPASAEFGGPAASPPLPPLPAPKSKTVRGLREKRNIAVPASAALKESPLPETLRRQLQTAKPRFRAQPSLGEPFHRVQEFVWRKRLRHVAIRALLLTPITVARRSLGSDQNHRDVGVRQLALQIAASLEPVAAWHHHVQQDHVGSLIIDRFFDLGGIGNSYRMKTALLQHGLHQVHFRLRIIYNQHFLRHHAPPHEWPSRRLQVRSHIHSSFCFLPLAQNHLIAIV